MAGAERVDDVLKVDGLLAYAPLVEPAVEGADSLSEGAETRDVADGSLDRRDLESVDGHQMVVGDRCLMDDESWRRAPGTL